VKVYPVFKFHKLLLLLDTVFR